MGEGLSCVWGCLLVGLMPLEELQKDCAFQTAKIHICGDKVGRSYASSVVSCSVWNSKVLGRVKEMAPVSRRLIRVCLVLVSTVCWLLGI